MPPTVALGRCAGYQPESLDPALDAVLAGVGGLSAYVRAGQRVLLKPNLIAAVPPDRGATTHPAVLEALARRVLDLGATPFIGDAPAWGGPVSVPAVTGIREVCDRLGLEFAFFDQHARLASRHPEVAHAFRVDPRVLAADVVINVPKLKAHQQLGFTGALKNLYGCLGGREKAYHHFARSRTDHHFARFLVAYQAALPVHLHVADGVISMEGTGPRLGTPRLLGVLAASTGATELDAVLAELIGVPAPNRLLLEAAAELGTGETDPARILVVGDPLAALRVDDYLHPHLVGVCFSPVRLVRGWYRNRRMLRAERVAGTAP